MTAMIALGIGLVLIISVALLLVIAAKVIKFRDGGVD